MATYRVKVVYGNPGQNKNSSQQITVEAESDSVAIELAINKFKNSNSTYRNKEVDAVDVRKI